MFAGAHDQVREPVAQSAGLPEPASAPALAPEASGTPALAPDPGFGVPVFELPPCSSDPGPAVDSKSSDVRPHPTARTSARACNAALVTPNPALLIFVADILGKSTLVENQWPTNQIIGDLSESLNHHCSVDAQLQRFHFSAQEDLCQRPLKERSNSRSQRSSSSAHDRTGPLHHAHET
jgi:hypothetical protein